MSSGLALAVGFAVLATADVAHSSGRSIAGKASLRRMEIPAIAAADEKVVPPFR